MSEVKIHAIGYINSKTATMTLRSFLLFSGIFILMDCPAQVQPGKDSATSTAAGTKPFRQNGSKTFWMGSNYRKEWNTKVTVPVIDLSTAYGGLTPVKKGGGKQTKSLRLEDANGREYSLRSVQKFITSKTPSSWLYPPAINGMVVL